MNQVLTDFQMMQSIGKALRDATKQLADAQVKVADAMSTAAIFEERFNFGEYERKDTSGVTLTTTQVNANLDSAIEIGSTRDTDRISAQMQEYIEASKLKQDESKKKWQDAISKCRCGKPHVLELDPDYSKAGDFVA